MKSHVNPYTGRGIIGIDPESIPGLVMYFDATNRSTITADANNKVSQWVSTKTPSVTLRQLDPAGQPELVPADDSLGCAALEFSDVQSLDFNPGGQTLEATDTVFIGFLPTRFDITNSAAILAGLNNFNVLGVQFLGSPINSVSVTRQDGTLGSYSSEGHFTEYLESRVLCFMPWDNPNPIRLDNYPLPVTNPPTGVPSQVGILRLGRARTQIDDPSATFTRIAFMAIYRGVVLTEAQVSGITDFMRAKMGLVKYPAAIGGTSRLDGNHVVKTFHTSGDLNVIYPGTASLLLVGGGGGGGYGAGGGGGGGGYRNASAVLTQGLIPIVVGAGGQGAASTSVAGDNGEPSSFDSQVALGGGGGGSPGPTGAPGSLGGSGGGAPGGTVAFGPGLGTSGQGNEGGAQGTLDVNLSGSGGGGSASPGEPSVAPAVDSFVLGGLGFDLTLEGVLKTYGVGGRGANSTYTGNVAPVDTNDGRGGNAGGILGAGQPGSSGVVIVRYPGRDFAYSHPLWDNLVLLIHGEGKQNSRNIYDSSRYNNHLVVDGSVRRDRKEYIRRSSIKFSRGASDVIQVSNDAFEIGTQDFTLSMWVKFETGSNNGNDFGVFQLSNTVGGRQASFTSSLTLRVVGGTFSWAVGNLLTTVANTALTNWQHVAVERYLGVTTLYLDGVATTSAADATSYGGVHACIGGNVDGAHSMLGHLDDVQLIVGEALYKTDFTDKVTNRRPLHGEDIKTDPYSDYVQLFLDGETALPNTSVFYEEAYNRRIEFNGRAHLAQDNYSGRYSFRFMGEPGCYLSIPSSKDSNSAFDFGTADFSIEFRCKKSESVLGQVGKVLALASGAFGVNSLGISLDEYNGFKFKYNSLELSASVTVDDEIWHHYAVVRHSDTMLLYVDGLSVASVSFAGEILEVTPPAYYVIGKDLSGMVDNFRVTKGVARYYGSFINPAEGTLQLYGELKDPYYANVPFMLAFDGIVGSLPIADDSKYGHANLNLESPITIEKEYVSGLGYINYANVAVEAVDGLRFPLHQDFDLVGDFTVEFHAAVSAEYGTSYGTVLSTDPSTGAALGGWFVELSTARGLAFNGRVDQAYITDGYTLPLDGSWHHYVIQRANGVTSAFIDGDYYANLASMSGSVMIEAGADLTVGQHLNGNYPFQGKLKNIRITNGVARYPSGFNSVFARLPRRDEVLSNLNMTSLVLQGFETEFHSEITDSGHYLSEVEADQVFVDNEGYVEGVFNFPAATDSWYGLEGVYSLESGKPYCIEFFVHPDPVANSNSEILLATSTLANASGGWSVELSTVNGIRFTENIGTLQVLDAAFPFDDKEHHVAIMRRSNGTLAIAIDGVQVSTAAGVLPSATLVGLLSIGDVESTNNAFAGRFRGLRITLGTARYNASQFAVPVLPFVESELTLDHLYGNTGMHADFGNTRGVVSVANKIVESYNTYPGQRANKFVQPVGGFQLDYLKADEVGRYVVEGSKTGHLPLTTPIDFIDLTMVIVAKPKGDPENSILNAVLGGDLTPRAVFGFNTHNEFTVNGNVPLPVEYPGLFGVFGIAVRVLEGKGHSARSIQKTLTAVDVETPVTIITNPDSITSIGQYGSTNYWWLEGQVGEVVVVDRAVPRKRLEKIVEALQRKWLNVYRLDGRPEMIVAPTAYSDYPGSNSSTPGTWKSDTPLTFTYAWKDANGVVVGTEPGFSIYAYVNVPVWLTITVTNSVGSVEWKSGAVYMMADS